MRLGLVWRWALASAGGVLAVIAGEMPGGQVWLSAPAGALIGFAVASAYFARPR